ncbi:MAG: LytTR family DNA-binding domain-containing protein [Bacteroidales bacterium]|jgi:two-component system LytT family response regulator|nr:LytTR family DNA-binding domain-containing protein [Bacteroidales bacterium]MCI2146160.1 LytTR family DNA-binding domain-containing protein [Bacteroidales bacterium]
MIKCIAIDDEPLALTQLEGYIRKVPFLELVKSCRDAISAIEFLDEGEADLIFIDINMPGINGLDFVKSLKKRPMVIFTTAYSEYAIEGFKVNAVDYLLKPFDYSDFLRATNKAYRQYSLLHTSKQERRKEDLSAEYIFIKAGYKITRVNVNDICYIEGFSEYVKIFTAGKIPLVPLITMKNIVGQFKSPDFIRIHRSYIINSKKISEISKNSVKLNNGISLPIGEQYRKNFDDFISKHTLH